ncbi:MAG: hypothetical protein ACI814_003752 [Mariniblastus sp.]
MRYNIKTLLILTTIIAFVLSAILVVNGAIQTRTIVNVDHPNGTRLRVIQFFNDQPELFTTSIYFDDGDGEWRWYYFDHQDSYWGGAEIEMADNEIRVTSKYRNVEFNTSTGECTTFHSGKHRFHEKSDTIKSLPAGFVEAPKPREAG